MERLCDFYVFYVVLAKVFCAYPKVRVWIILVPNSDGSSPKTTSPAELKKFELKPGPNLGPSEKVKPEPRRASNFYSLKAPIFWALAWIEPEPFSKCRARALQKRPGPGSDPSLLPTYQVLTKSTFKMHLLKNICFTRIFSNYVYHQQQHLRSAVV